MNRTDNERLMALLMQMPMLLRKQINRPVRRQTDLPPLQIYVLHSIARHGHINMTRLSQDVDVRSQQLTRLVESLVKRGLVERLPDPTSRRVILVGLTDLGRAFLEELKCQVTGVLAPFVDRLSESDRQAFLNAIDTIHRIVEQQQQRVTPH